MGWTGVPLLLCVAACGSVAALILYGSLVLQGDLTGLGGRHLAGPLSRPASPHGERALDHRGAYVLPGYASIHGQKHHGHLLWPGNASEPGAIVVFWGPSDRMRPGGKGPTYGLLRRLARGLPRVRAHIVTPGKMRTFDELFRRETGRDRKSSQSWLSTGWFTMGVSLDLCDRLHVYGMVPPSYCRSPGHRRVPYHYYEPGGADECSMLMWHERGRRGSHHRFLTEKRVFARWARAYNITFSHPDWNE